MIKPNFNNKFLTNKQRRKKKLKVFKIKRKFKDKPKETGKS